MGHPMRAQFRFSLRNTLTAVRIATILLGNRLTADAAEDVPASRPVPANNTPASSWTLASPLTVTLAHRLSWNLQTTVSEYRAVGHTNALWDAEVEEGLTAFAHLRAEGATSNFLATARRTLTSAQQQGCRDPLVGYILVRGQYPDPEKASLDSVAAHRAAAKALSSSGYHPLRRFFGAVRTANELRNIPLPDGDESLKALAERDDWQEQAFKALRAALLDASLPLLEATDAIQQLRYNNPLPTLRKKFYPVLSSALRGRWPDRVEALCVVGALESDLGWAFRGSRTSDQVTEEGWEGLERHLERAARALQHAWDLGPTNLVIPTLMMDVAMRDSDSISQHELWFRRAMELDPNSYEACERKLTFLLPQWHGSHEQLLAFGRECAASPHWGGRVPLILVDAHKIVAGPTDRRQPFAYWRKPGVWEDLEASFEKFFRLNPSQTSWYHNYALYAFRCGNYDRFNELLPKLGPINYEYFGGQAVFESMVRTTKEKLAARGSAK